MGSQNSEQSLEKERAASRYQNLSRRYRPTTFASIIGQEAVVITLKNSIRSNRVSSAYLFCGPRGTGKTTAARLFAKTLNCHSVRETVEPCNECPSCLEIMQGRSLDVLEIDGASNRGIDDIRQLNETLGYSTASGKYKIYIIDEVHMLTKEAFNALLKNLEEPPSHVKFFFATTEPQKLPATILSRCQRFELRRLTTSQIVSKLETIAGDLGVAIEPKAVEFIAHVAEGGLRDAESILDQLLCFAEKIITYESVSTVLGTIPRHLHFKLDEAIQHGNLKMAFEISHALLTSGVEFQPFLDSLLDHFRNHLLLNLRLPFASPLNPGEEAHYRKMSSIFSQEHLLYLLEYLTGWMKEASKTPFRRVTLEMILLHLIRSLQRVSLPTLVRRLEELQSRVQIDNTSQEESITASTETLKIEEIPSVLPKNTASERPKSHYDTILRFAAVELEGIVKKQ